jgi:hypothetical protein
MTEWGYFSMALLVLASLVAYWAHSKHTVVSPATTPFVLPPGVAMTSVSLLTEDDVTLYNVMRLAVQDEYLVFAQVPLWSFVSIEAMGKARAQVLNQIALKRVDFLLVHPGSRRVEHVIQVEEASPRPHQIERQRVIEAVVIGAGIKLVKLRAQTRYAVPELTKILGLEPQE